VGLRTNFIWDKTMKKYLFLLMLMTNLGCIGFADAQVSIKDPWIRVPAPGQKVAGAYMQITSMKTVFLVSGRSTAAKSVEIHEMSIDNNVMKMRPIPRLELSAGKPVELRPGGYHIMLIDLARTLHKGDIVPITLTVEDPSGQRQTIDVKATVRDAASSGGHHGGM
jgi:periplasmic copper chaperone A